MYYPRRRGIIDQILTGAQTVMGIANFVRGWQNQGSLQESRELEGLAAKLKLAEAINPNQPISLNEGLGAAIEKKGIPVPRLTPERVAQAQDVAVSQAPGSVNLPAGQTTEEGVTVSTGGRATPMAEVQRRQAQGRSIAESLGPVGGYAPKMPQPTKIGILGRSGGFRVETAPPGVNKIMTEPTPPASHVLFDREGKPVANTGTARPHFLPKPEKTPEQLEAEAAAKTRGKWAATPEGTIYDPETNMQKGTFKRRPFYAKSPDQGGVNFVTPDQAREAQQQGRKLPKGTRVLKDTEVEDWNKARGRAIGLAKNQFDLSRPGQQEKMDKYIENQTKVEFNAIQGKRGKGQGGSQTPPINLLKEGHQTEFKNGQVWSLQGGKPKRIR